ncbi:MAG: hypothetical protein ORN98_08345 [Alphaproteobacteria bacterium]|nr:hypothetical protein [Alphaproteobacteria bacterium]
MSEPNLIPPLSLTRRVGSHFIVLDSHAASLCAVKTTAQPLCGSE